MIELAMISVAASKACVSESSDLLLLGEGLQDHFKVDRHRMIAAGDDVLLVHVRGGEAMKERQPCAGPPEEPLGPLLIGAARMVDEFGPAVTVAYDRARRFEFDGSAGAIQSLDEFMPSGVEAQVFRLVHHARAVLER